MPLETVRLRPGIDTEQTPTLNSAGWSKSNLIRWREGLPEKLGGWQHLNSTTIIGTGRGSHAWSDINGNGYYAVGTEQRLEILNSSMLYDITPYRKVTNAAAAFTTVNGSKTVSILDAGHGLTTGDWVLIPIPVSVGGIIIQGFYTVTVTDANNFTIQASAAATASTTGGAVPVFNTTNTSATVQVILANHGLVVNQLFGVQVATTGGGITIAVGSYTVTSIVASSIFTIVPNGPATSSTTFGENGNNAIIDYLAPTGQTSPYRKTDNITPNFTTASGSATVTVIDAGHGCATGDTVIIPVPVSVGGLIVEGTFPVTVVDVNNYTILMQTPATATAVSTGSVPVFLSFNTTTTIEVSFANHGLLLGQMFAVQVQTLVGGITIVAGSYAVTAVLGSSLFSIVPGGTATSDATVAVNGGNVRLQYSNPPGYSGVITIRQWLLDHWGGDLIGNYTTSPMLVWIPPLVTIPGVPWPANTNPVDVTPANAAQFIDTTNFPSAIDPPVHVNVSFVAMPQRIAVACGVDPAGGGTQDPNLVRWCDVDDFTDWLATATNQAGSYRLPTGSKIVGAIQAPQFAVIWTDIDMYLMQYLGFPLVFGFNKIAAGCELFASRAAGVYSSAIYWPSSENFFVFDGNSVQVLECTVWDEFFQNVNMAQRDKVWCWVNSVFNEIWWFFPSLTATDCDSYIKYHTVYRVWDYGTMSRTTGVDTNVLGTPLAVDTSGLIQQHEIGYNADGVAMLPSIQSGWFNIADGSFFTFIERLIADFVLTGGTAPSNRVYISILVQNYPTDPVYTYGPYAWTPQGPPYSIVRGRGRSAAVLISSSDLGVFWRLGALRYLGQPAGRR